MTILIMDDDLYRYESLKQSFEKEGHCVHFSVCGEGCELMAKTEPYDLIIMGNSLTEDERLKTCREIRRTRVDMPIIVLAETNSEESAVMALEAGADYYLVSPIYAKELLARAHALLRRHPKPFVEQRCCVG